MKYLTDQEIFDKSVGGILEQGEFATDEIGNCVYQNEQGNGCGIAKLFDPEHYDPDIENLTMDCLDGGMMDCPKASMRTNYNLKRISFLRILDANGVKLDNERSIELMVSLQLAHDNCAELSDEDMSVYKERCKEIAANYPLVWNF